MTIRSTATVGALWLQGGGGGVRVQLSTLSDYRPKNYILLH